MAISQDHDKDWAKYLGRCFHPISDRECLDCIHPLTAEPQTIDKVRIRVNYYSSREEYNKSRNVNVDAGICTPFGILGLNTKYDKETHESGHQDSSYYVYHCEVINYSVSGKQAGINHSVSEKLAGINRSVSEKLAGIKSKPSANCYINSVTYGGYLRIVVEITEMHADVKLRDFAELDVELTEIHSSINLFTDFLRSKSDRHRYDTFRYQFLFEHSGQGETSNINADNIGATVDAFISNVRHNRDKSVVLHYSYSPCSVDPVSSR